MANHEDELSEPFSSPCSLHEIDPEYSNFGSSPAQPDTPMKPAVTQSATGRPPRSAGPKPPEGEIEIETVR